MQTIMKTMSKTAARCQLQRKRRWRDETIVSEDVTRYRDRGMWWNLRKTTQDQYWW